MKMELTSRGFSAFIDADNLTDLSRLFSFATRSFTSFNETETSWGGRANCGLPSLTVFFQGETSKAFLGLPDSPKALLVIN